MDELQDINYFIEEVRKEYDDQDLVGDILSEKPDEKQYEERCIMVFNIPVVGSDRLPKLRNVLAGLFSIQNVYKYTDHYPLDDEDKTKGYCFLEYQTKEAANAAIAICNGHRLDKNHTFTSYPFTSIREIKQPQANWKKPEQRPYIDLGDLWYWIQNPKCLDQFAIQYETDGGLQLDVYTHARAGDPTPIEDAQRNNWSEDIFKWSPHGSYLTTLHSRGIALWGGQKFLKFQRFEHEGVNYIDFSPNEKYIVSYSCGTSNNLRDNENCLRVFEVFTGEMLKAFSPSGKSTSNRLHEWPFVKWSSDEKYFAYCRLQGNCINLFSTDDFMLSDNKVIDLDGLVQFEFNPTKNLIAYYCEEKTSAGAPAEFGILEIPSRQKIRPHRIFSVFQANLFWQKAGSYLAVHTERYQKMVKGKDGEIKYTGVASHLEIFDCTGKEIPFLTMQLPEPFVNFAWEPKGSKFCVLVGTSTRITPLIYQHDKGKTIPQLLGKIEAGNNLNSIAWAPQGGWLTVYGANTPNGIVNFIDANGTDVTRTRSIEHNQLSQAFWDPTGRYFVTCTFGGKTRYETGYRFYSFMGREIIKKNIDSMMRFKWRPRPPVQLPEQKIREIRKSLKQLSLKFEEEDKRELQKVSKEIIEFRQNALSQFENIRRQANNISIEERESRLALRGGFDPRTTEMDFVDETITVPIQTERVEIPREELANSSAD